MSAALERLEGGRNILTSPDFEAVNFEPEHVSCCLNLGHLQNREGISGIGHDRQTAETRDNLMQELESFANKIGRLERQTGDVAARSRKARNESSAERISRRGEDDRYS